MKTSALFHSSSAFPLNFLGAFLLLAGLVSLLVPRIRAIEQEESIKSNGVIGMSDAEDLDMDLFWNSGSRRVKRQVLDHGVTPEDIAMVIDEHNKYRRLEPASEMHILRWSDELARSAKHWADLCQWKHGQPPLDLYPGLSSPLGQNLYVSTSKHGARQHLNSSMLSWWREKTMYSYPQRQCSGVCGHYTQMIWSNTREIGCGLTVCPTMQIGGNVWNQASYVVCNYSPAGNYIGQWPYTIGTACSGCNAKFGSSNCVDGLCDSTTTPTTTTTTPTTTTTTPTTTTTTPTTTTTTPTTTTTTPTTTTPTPTTTTTTPTTTTTTPTTTTPTPTTTTTTPTTTTTTPTTTTTTPTTTTTTPTTPTTTTTTPTAPTTTPTTNTTTPTTTTTTPTTTTTTITTTPTTTTTTPTTTTTTQTTTTPTSTTSSMTTAVTTRDSSDSCPDTVCHNGGSAVRRGEHCSCSCTEKWEGEQCQDNVAETKFCIVMVVFPVQKVMAHLQQIINIMKRTLTRSLNSRCRSHPSRCCGVQTTRSYRQHRYLTYTSEDYISLAHGYPRAGYRSGRQIVFFRMLAKSEPGNSLCAAVRNDLDATKIKKPRNLRKRRSIIEIPRSVENATFVDQEILFEAAQDAMETLDVMLAVYNITLEDVLRAAAFNSSTVPAHHPHVMPAWSWAIIGVVAVIFISQLVVCVVLCLRKRKPKYQQEGIDNSGYNAEASSNPLKHWFQGISVRNIGYASQPSAESATMTPLKMVPQPWDPHRLYGQGVKPVYDVNNVIHPAAVPVVLSPYQIGYPHQVHHSQQQMAAHIPRIILHQAAPRPEGLLNID